MILGGIRDTQEAEDIVQKEQPGKTTGGNLISRRKVVPLEIGESAATTACRCEKCDKLGCLNGSQDGYKRLE